MFFTETDVYDVSDFLAASLHLNTRAISQGYDYKCNFFRISHKYFACFIG